MLSGLVFNLLVTMLWHPSGEEDVHESIFAEYADSEPWVIVHVGQFIGVLLVLAGLLVLCRAVYRSAPHLALFAAASTLLTAATWAALQGVDGVAVKETAAAWVGASPAEEAGRFGDAEAVRWIEWGLQSYTRILFGLALLLLAGALLVSRRLPGWLGPVAAAAGALSVAIGIDVGYSGLASGFQDIGVPVFQLLVLAFAIGVVTAKTQEHAEPAPAG